MNVILQIMIGAIASIIMLILVLLVVIPYIKLQAKRREARGHTPQPEEIWVQDDGILYVDNVNQQGVELMTITIAKDGTKNFQRWRDSWPEWHERLRVRTVFFSGQRRPLGNS
jgi:lipopolysaccharide export LptBFGC system permease protein LptF